MLRTRENSVDGVYISGVELYVHIARRDRTQQMSWVEYCQVKAGSTVTRLNAWQVTCYQGERGERGEVPVWWA
jgi:hypothetical protein